MPTKNVAVAMEFQAKHSICIEAEVPMKEITTIQTWGSRDERSRRLKIKRGYKLNITKNTGC